MAVTFVLIFICVAIFLLDYLWKPKIHLPSPFRIPVLGHILFIGKQPYVKFSTWAKEIGSMFVIQALNKTVVVLNSYDAINEVMREKNEEFAAKPFSFRNNLLDGSRCKGPAKGIFFQDTNDQWKKMKDYTTRQLNEFASTDAHSAIALDICEELAELIQTQSNGGIIDPIDHVHSAVCCYCYSVISGKKESLTDPIFKRIKHAEPQVRLHSGKRGKELDMLPLLRFVGNESFKALSNAVDTDGDLFAKLKEEKPSQGVGSAFLDGKDGLEVTDDVRGVILGTDCYYAAVGGPFGLLCGYLMLMATHQEIQSKIFAEVSTILKQKGAKNIEPSDRSQMPYTAACLQEVLRYFIAVPMIPRRAKVDTSIQGVAIPKDTNIIINSWGYHHDEKYWEDPWEFKPERFLDSSGKVLPHDHPTMRKLVQQGHGLRQCLGYKPSHDITFTVMANMVSKFHIIPVGGIDVTYDPRTWEEYSLTIVPKSCQLKFNPRE